MVPNKPQAFPEHSTTLHAKSIKMTSFKTWNSGSEQKGFDSGRKIVLKLVYHSSKGLLGISKLFSWKENRMA